MPKDDKRTAEEIAGRRDDTVRRMIATPPKTQRGTPKRPPSSSKGKRGS